MSAVHAYCPHLLAMPKQASVTIEGTRHCAACGVDAIEKMLPASTPGAIANALQFDSRTDRIGTVGAMLLLWSFLKMQSDAEQRRLANRLGRVLNELRALHGNLFSTADSPQQEV